MNISDAFGNLMSGIINALPTSPFAPYIAQFSNLPYMGWLNWFIPVGAILDVMAAWLAAVLVFYVYSVLARWLKIIGD